jgi:hypothetical protein
MSFIRLLAAGRSVIGIRKSRGPFRMRQENLLPHFEPLQSELKSAAEPAVSAPDLASPEPAVLRAEPVESSPVARVEKKVPVQRLGLASRLAAPLKRFGSLLRRGSRSASAKGPARRHVQTEFAIARIKVVRNDLSDSDIEFIPAMKQPSQPPAGGAPPRSGRMQPLGIIWNRLSASLLRRAAQEFHTNQKERGKLLAQIGPDGGGARGS